MRVLVTGCAGFIGAALCGRLAGRGHQVTGIDNFDDYYDPALKRSRAAGISASRVIEGDLRDPHARNEAFEFGCDVLVHLAARPGVYTSVLDPVASVEQNVLVTAAVLEECANRGVRHMLFASSSTVYGDAKPPFSEDLPCGLPTSPYGASKRSCELLGASMAASRGLNFTALRLFSVYGPRGRPDIAFGRFLAAIRDGEPVTIYGDGSASRDFTYIDDVLDGIEIMMELPGGFQVMNLARGKAVSVLELAESIASALDKPLRVEYRPARASELPHTLANIDRARAQGFRPKVDLPEGLRRLVSLERSS